MSDSEKNSHELKRCVFCELQMQNKMKHGRRDFNHVDEICTQIYMDSLGYGFNKEPESW